MTDPDGILQNFLAPPDRPTDYQFAEAVRRQVVAEEQLKAARKRAWTRFGYEALASSGLVALLMLLSSRPSLFVEGDQPAVFSPLTTVLLLFGIWTATTLRPSPQRA
jgi:hypothetical protein